MRFKTAADKRWAGRKRVSVKVNTPVAVSARDKKPGWWAHNDFFNLYFVSNNFLFKPKSLVLKSLYALRITTNVSQPSSVKVTMGVSTRQYEGYYEGQYPSVWRSLWMPVCVSITNRCEGRYGCQSASASLIGVKVAMDAGMRQRACHYESHH